MRRWIGGAVAALAALACAWWIWTASLERELDRRILALRRAGLPVDRRAFLEAPVPPEEDAAPLYAEVLEWNRAHPLLISWKAPADYDPEERQMARAWLDEATATIATLQRAVERPACSHSYDMELSPFLWDAWLLRLANDVRDLAEVRVGLSIHDGEGVDEAMHAIQRLAMFARHLDDRLLIGALVRSFAETKACVLLRDLAGRGSIELRRARRLVMRWTRRSPGRTTAEVLAWERAAVLEALRPGRIGVAGEGDTPEWVWSSFLARPALALHAMRQLDRFEQGIRMTRNLTGARLSELLRTRAGQDQRLWFEPFTPLGRWFAMHLAHVRFRRAAWLNVTATGLDVLAWRDAHGRWPDSLDGCPDAVDPFTGEPLVYERTAAGVRVAARDPDPDEDEPLEWVLTD